MIRTGPFFAMNSAFLIPGQSGKVHLESAGLFTIRSDCASPQGALARIALQRSDYLSGSQTLLVQLLDRGGSGPNELRGARFLQKIGFLGLGLHNTGEGCPRPAM